MGNEVSIGPSLQNPCFQLENSHQGQLPEDSNFINMSPIHRYTNYKTTIPIKTISSLRLTNNCQFPSVQHFVQQKLSSNPELQPLQKIGHQKSNTQTAIQQLDGQNKAIQIQNTILNSQITNKPLEPATPLRQNNTGQKINSPKEQSENEFKSLVINFQNFVELKQQKIKDYYDFKETLGEGAYGQVFRAICKKTGQERAIKKIKIKSMKLRKRKQLLSELNLLSKLSHPSIIMVYEVFLCDDKYFVVMEYCKGGAAADMLHKCKEKSEKTISYIIKQLLSALSYMHSRNIVHRDIKLDNIVFLHPIIERNSQDQNIHIKIIDFGTAVEFQGKELCNYRQTGTLSYMAPEVLRGVLSTKSDIWSVGVLLVILLTGTNPFKGGHQSITKANIHGKVLKLDEPPFSSLSAQAKNLISLMLERNHLKRISAGEALSHPWFSNSNKAGNSLTLQSLNQLFRYQKGNNLISVIESYISLKRITQEQRERLGEIFNAIDTDGNGTIDIPELLQMYHRNIDSNYTPEEVTQIIKSIDKDKSGKIDFNQFILVMQGRKNLFITEFLADAFEYYDEDKTGYLDRQQITEILKGGDIIEINKIIKKLDTDGDTRISKEEFISYFKNY